MRSVFEPAQSSRSAPLFSSHTVLFCCGMLYKVENRNLKDDEPRLRQYTYQHWARSRRQELSLRRIGTGHGQRVEVCQVIEFPHLICPTSREVLDFHLVGRVLVSRHGAWGPLIKWFIFNKTTKTKMRTRSYPWCKNSETPVQLFRLRNAVSYVMGTDT